MTNFDFITSGSILEHKIIQAWDKFILKHIEEEILKSKVLKDFVNLRIETRPNSEARNRVDAVIEKNIEKLLSNYQKPVVFAEACQIFNDNSNIMLRILKIWSKFKD